MTVLIAFATNEPVVGAFRLTGHSDIVTRLSLQVARVVPVAGHIADELEGIIELLIVLRQVGSHLKRRIHREVECQ